MTNVLSITSSLLSAEYLLLLTAVLPLDTGCLFGVTGLNCKCTYPRDCQDWRDLGFKESKVYHVVPVGTYKGFGVYCDMKVDDGGWLVFQRRINGSEDFDRIWDDYEEGFGDPEGEFWLGNLPLHAITSQGHYTLRIDVEDWNGSSVFADYKIFKIANSTQNYRLTAENYQGNAGDSLSYHSGNSFSAKDIDNDNRVNKSCYNYSPGGWWLNDCRKSNLNGHYKPAVPQHGIVWYHFRGFNISLKRSEMKLRRV